MSISLYDATVAGFIRTTEAVAGILKKGRDYYQEHALDLESATEERLCGDMLPLHFQINSVRHHSLVAIQSAQSGHASIPAPMEKTDYDSLEAFIAETLEGLNAFSEDEVNGLYGKDVVFKLGERELPFTAENFLLSFSIPNFHFHATTTYDIFRMKGVPLGKRDYMGKLVLKMS